MKKQVEEAHCLHSQVSPVNPYKKGTPVKPATTPAVVKKGVLPSTPASPTPTVLKQSSLPSFPATPTPTPTLPKQASSPAVPRSGKK